MIVNPGQIVSYNYPTYDQAVGLHVGATLYDVTTGSAVFVSGPTALADLGNGVYENSFIPTSNRSYLVILLVYLDSGLTMVDTTRAPGAQNYDAFTSDSHKLNFNYGAYDLDSSLTLSAVIFNITDVTSATVSMAHVLGGVYFGTYSGIVGKSYCVVKSPSDTSRPPGADDFQAYTFSGGGGTTINIFEAAVIGQSLNATLVAD